MGETAYYPRRLGVLAPRGEEIYEVVVVGEDKVGSLEGVLQIFAKHFVNLIFTTAYDSTASGDFMLNTFADLSKSEGTVNDIKSDIGRLSYVKSVQMEKVNEGRFSRFLFPVTTGHNRVLIFGANSLMAIEKHMIERDGQKGGELLYEFGRTAGMEVASEQRKFLPWAKSDALMTGAVDQLRAFGWGIFDFHIGPEGNGPVKVTVRGPVFSEVPETSGSMLLVGLASGVLEGAYGSPTMLSGVPDYSQETHEYRFELRPTKIVVKRK